MVRGEFLPLGISGYNNAPVVVMPGGMHRMNADAAANYRPPVSGDEVRHAANLTARGLAVPAELQGRIDAWRGVRTQQVRDVMNTLTQSVIVPALQALTAPRRAMEGSIPIPGRGNYHGIYDEAHPVYNPQAEDAMARNGVIAEANNVVGWAAGLGSFASAKTVATAVKCTENVAKNARNAMFDPPKMPLRTLAQDYPNGARTDAAGRLTRHGGTPTHRPVYRWKKNGS